MRDISTSLEHTATIALERSKYRLTSARRTILAILENSKKPITVNDIVNTAPNLVLSSIYRNLMLLEQVGLVKRIVSDHNFAYYELDEEVLGHHHHLLCNGCGEVLDIRLPGEIEKTLEKISKSLSKKNKYKDIDHSVDFTGKCSKCQ